MASSLSLEKQLLLRSLKDCLRISQKCSALLWAAALEQERTSTFNRTQLVEGLISLNRRLAELVYLLDEHSPEVM